MLLLLYQWCRDTRFVLTQILHESAESGTVVVAAQDSSLLKTVSVSNTIFQYDWVNCDQAWRVTNATSEQFKAGIVRARHAVCWIWERLNLGTSPWVECNVRQQLVVSNSINMNVRTCIIICSKSNETKEHKLKLRDSFWHDKASGRQWGRLRCTMQYNLRHP